MMKYLFRAAAVRRSLVAPLLLTVVLLSDACSKEEPQPLFEVSSTEIFLSGDASGEESITVRANRPWEVTYTGEDFTVTSTDGTASEGSVTVTPTQANDEPNRRRLGSILLHFDNDRQQIEVAVYQRPATATRTVLLYMPGQSLLRFYKENIARLRSAVNTDNPGDGRMLICYQPESRYTAVLEELRYDSSTGSCKTITLKHYDTFDTGNPEDVARLFADAAEEAPAERYGLIIGCHGKAWIPASSGALPRSRRAGGAAADVWTPAAGAKPTRSFGDTGHELDITELASVLEALPFRFDYLIFDDCFMANIETLYDLRHAIDYVVASPCEIMAAGFPYDRILPHLFDDEELRPQLGEICREFWNFYQNDWNTISGNEQSGCISLTVMSELEALASEMRRVVEAPKTDFELSELQYYKGGTTKLFYDLGHYVQLSCGDQGTIDTFEAQLERAVPSEYRFHTPSYYSAYNNLLNPITCYTGITTSEPETTEPYASDFRHTSWYLATH